MAKKTSIFLITGVAILAALILIFLLQKSHINEEECGTENCHGMDLICGPNPVEACDAMYMLGDRCRQYAECKIVDGKCTVVKNETFDECKACIERCEKDYGEDPIQVFSCESRCTFEIPEESMYCVDNFGNPGNHESCGKIDLLDRLCSESGECTATCGLGCMNKDAYLQGVVDCKAIPQYDCECVKGFCQKR